MTLQKRHSNKRLLVTFTALVSLLPIVLLLSVLVLPTQYDHTFLGEMKYKVSRLQSTKGKRIILVGGSSVPFGVKSELLASSFSDYEIVDFGMYAELGTVIMLDWAKTEVHEGDIFLLMPEQDEQTLSCYFSGEAIWQCADGAMELIPQLSSKRYERLAASFLTFSGKRLFYSVNGGPEVEGIYARSSFNEYGDISYPDRTYNIMSGGYNPNQRISFAESIITKDLIQEMNEFTDSITAKGAHVYYHFSPMNELALTEDSTKLRIDSYYNFLQQQLNFPILGNPHACILDSGWFYDTNFHLNDSGATVFTKTLIEELKTIFKDTSITNIALPAMPEVSVTLTDGDNSYLDCFTYQQVDDGWVIDGLTKKGQASSSIILPVTYQEEPVIGISESIFHDNTKLSELTIQPNIGILQDGMFRGCSNLKKLILTGKPSSYSIGTNLREGADFLIQVPEQWMDNYRRHYSWQKYSSYFVAE